LRAADADSSPIAFCAEERKHLAGKICHNVEAVWVLESAVVSLGLFSAE